MKLHKSLLLFGATALVLAGCVDEGLDTDEESEVDEPDTEEVSETEPGEQIEEDELTGEQNEEVDSELPEELEDLHVSDVRDDTTGDWRKVVDSKNFNMPENALGYYDEYMEEDEIHFLISFATNTTISINEVFGELYVDIYEYEDGEEHSANEMPSGMLLKSYIVNLDSGEIEETE